MLLKLSAETVFFETVAMALTISISLRRRTHSLFRKHREWCTCCQVGSVGRSAIIGSGAKGDQDFVERQSFVQIRYRDNIAVSKVRAFRI